MKSIITSFDQQQRALRIYEQRATLIARNIANSNTPGFKAQDINFAETMGQVQMGLNVDKTQEAHISSSRNQDLNRVYYRVPMQSKMDDNTVDDEIERKNFIENSLRYQAGISFIQGRANKLVKAFRGD